jgi:uncharacterized protein (TIGR01244 family)
MEAVTMRKLLLLLVLGSTLAIADGDPGNDIKVDLEHVVKQDVAVPVDGLSAAGQPNPAALRVFADSGYVAVIDMRTAGENRGFDEPATVERLGMEYVPFPISGDDITFGKARELDALLQQYDEPVLLHCASSNRVGALLALREFLASGDADRALETGRQGGMTSLEGRVRNALDEAAGQ